MREKYSYRIDYPEGKKKITIRPPGVYGQCHAFEETQCKEHPECNWITLKEGDNKTTSYCRSPLGSVKKLLKETKPTDICLTHNDMKSCQDDSECLWIEQKRGNKSQYCKHQPRPHLGGRYYSTRSISPESKKQWFKSDYEEPLTKYCRCIFESEANHLLGGSRKEGFNPYPVCLNSIASAAAKGEKSKVKALASELTWASRQGKCSQLANFDVMPIEVLYSYAYNKRNTARGRKFLSEVPDIDEFLTNKESYRDYLLEQIQLYNRGSITPVS